MISILTIIGARPQIIKASALSRTIRKMFSDKISEIIVHTGQHYDKNMSEVFFNELEIPLPDYNLNVGSGLHGQQTALMIKGIEELILKVKPDVVVLYGDTNSTLAGSIASAKLRTPIVHIEAGLRSFNKSMPEEINRIVCDHASTLLFVPTVSGIDNLKKESINVGNEPPFSIDNPGVFHCGDVMYDNADYFSGIAQGKCAQLLAELGVEKDRYILATIHRDSNTDNPVRLNEIFNSFMSIVAESNMPIVLPIHPRTSKMLKLQLKPELYHEINNSPLIKIHEPVSFLEMIVLESNSFMIITDSGGVQKESYFYKKPCLIIRSETEWVEIVNAGAAEVCDADENKILNSFKHFVLNRPADFPLIFGKGKSAEFICQQIISLKLK